MSVTRRQPPRLVALVLIAVFVMVSLEVRQRVRRSVEENLDAAQETLARMENAPPRLAAAAAAFDPGAFQWAVAPRPHAS